MSAAERDEALPGDVRPGADGGAPAAILPGAPGVLGAQPAQRERWREALHAGTAAARRAWQRLRGPARAVAGRLGARLGALALAGVGALRVLLLGGLFAALALALGAWLCVRVPPGWIGVRQSAWGGGVVPADHAPGLYLVPRGLTSFTLLDARTQLMAFAHESDGGSEEMLRVRTKDGNVARVAVSVPYRVIPGEGHLLVAEGLRGVWHDLVRSSARKVLLVELAELSSDEFADTELRLARVREALPILNRSLADVHVRAESIEVRMVFFPKEYEATLQKSQLSRQLARLAEAAGAVEDEALAVGRLEADIEREVREARAASERAKEELRAAHLARMWPIEAEAASYRDLRRAEAEAEETRLVSEGDSALARIGALRTELRAAALAGANGRLWLAREAARTLRFSEIVLDSGDARVPSPLDLDGLVRVFLGSDAMGGAER